MIPTLHAEPPESILSTKEAYKKKKAEPVPTPHGKAFVRVLSGKERDEWTRLYKAEQEKATESTCEAIYCPLLVRALSDADGNRLYKDDETAELAESDSKLLALLFEAALNINRMGKESVDDEKKG